MISWEYLLYMALRLVAALFRSLQASSYDQYDLLPTEIEVLNKHHRGKAG